MHNVTVPTYDEEGEPTSILRAEEVVVKNQKRVVLEINKGMTEVIQGNDPLKIEFDKGRYVKAKNLLSSSTPTKIYRSNIEITGQKGMAVDLETKEIFLNGKTKTVIIPEEVATLILKNAMMLIAQPALELTEEQKEKFKEAEEFVSELPLELSDKDKEKIKEAKEIANDTLKKIEDTAEVIKKEGEAILEKANLTEENLKEFSKKAGKKLIKDETKEPKKPNLNQKFPPQALVITCEGGTYFDAEKNVLVYLKNVVAEDDEMKLECSKDLKVFFDEKKEKAETEDKEELSGFGSLDMKELLASGNVKITYKKTGDRPHYIATGEVAHFKMKEEELIIKGGFPKLRQGQQLSEALALGMWVKLSQKGVVWSKGPQRLVVLKDK